MQRERHLRFLVRNAVSTLIRGDPERVADLLLPRSLRDDIARYLSTPPHERFLEEWFGLQLRRKVLYYWSLPRHEESEDLKRRDIQRCADHHPAFEFHGTVMSYYGNLHYENGDPCEEDFHSKLCRCSESQETRQFLIVSCRESVLDHTHVLYRLIETFRPPRPSEDGRCHCTDLVLLSDSPPEVFFSKVPDTLKVFFSVRRDGNQFAVPRPPTSSSPSDALIDGWFENRPRRKALYYWTPRGNLHCLHEALYPYWEITRRIPDRSQICYTKFCLYPGISYPENCRFIVVDRLVNVPDEEFVMRSITKNIVESSEGRPDVIFISNSHPGYVSGFTPELMDKILLVESHH